MIRVLSREVAQAVMVPTTLVSSWVGDVGKELPRAEPVVFMLFRASKPKCTAVNLPSMRMLRGYLRDNNYSTNVLSFKTHYNITRGSCSTVDAKAIRVLPREVAQAVMVPTTLVSSWVGYVGKELPRAEPVVCMLFGASKPKSTAGNLPSMGMFRGYLRDNHCSTNMLSLSVLFLTNSRSCHLRINSFIEDE